MKKISFIAASAAALGMLFSCTNEKFETGNAGLVPVTVTASLEDAMPVSKALPEEAPTDHQLRCIMVVDYPTATDSRYETVATGNNNFTFSFTPLENGYTCLLWADYVATGIADEEGRYADKYYDTKDLKAIGYVAEALTDGSLFNNAACDAFYGTLAQGKTSVTLYRPFTRLTFKNTGDAAIEGVTSLGVSYTVYSGFNVADGTAPANATIAMTGGTPADAPGGVWFYNYIFAPKDKNRLPEGNITFRKNEDEARNISTENIPLDSNADQGFSFTYGESVDITVDVEDNFGEKPKPEAHVGDYFYSDGTYSVTLDSDKEVIGVIFALADGAAEGDVPANYPDSPLADAEKINGWVVALHDGYNTSYGKDTPGFCQEALTAIPDNVMTGKNCIEGYKNSKAWSGDKFFAVLNAINYGYKKEEATITVKAPETTSSWYLPTLQQMIIMIDAKETISSIITEAGGEFLGTNSNYWTSSADGTTTADFGPYRINSDNKSNAVRKGGDIKSGSPVRPILTF